MEIKVSDKYQALWQPRTRYFLITGGRGSAKSFTVGLWACNMLLAYKNWKVLFTRYTLSSANISVIPEFREKIDLLGVGDEFNMTNAQIGHKVTKSEIIFSGIKTSSGNQTAKLKSIPGLNVFIVDEAEEFVSEKDFDTIDESIRMPDTPNLVVLVMNPQDVEHWIWKRWFEKSHRMETIDGHSIPISTHEDITHIHTTYLDNYHNISKDYVAKIEAIKTKSPEAYAHRFLGKWLDKKQGVIFPNWVEGEFDNSLPFAYGLDFGFYPDPLALVKVAVDTTANKIYVKEIIYEQSLSYDMVVTKIRNEVETDAMIVADTSEPRLIDALLSNGMNVHKTEKYAGSVVDGIKRMLDFTIVVTEESYNLKHELRNYIWNDKKSSTPLDADNHCFVGETLITTNKGLKRIDQMQVNDYVLTSNGFQRVLLKHCNGLKQVNKYLIQFDTFLLSLTCTKDHLIKTSQGWKQIQELKKGMKIYLIKSSTGKNITSIQTKGIFLKELKECTLKFGNFITVKFLKIIMFIIKMAIQGITILQTLNALKPQNICPNTANKELLKIKNGLKTFRKKELQLHQNGINHQRELNGIGNTQIIVTLDTKHTGKDIALFVQRFLLKILKGLNFAQTNVNQHIEGVSDLMTLKSNALFVKENLSGINIQKQNVVAINAEELKEAKVYDLMIENNHEYFANGILVHNCIDALRYGSLRLMQGSDSLAHN
jgi:phage terminase large subunit